MILFNINLVLQSELSPEKIKRPSRPPRMRSGWLFDEVDVTVNTEGFYFLYSSILHVCSFVSLS